MNSPDDENREGDKTWWMRASLMSGMGQWLIDSVEQDDLEDLRELLNCYPPPDSIDRVKETDIEKAFYYAANGHADACRILYQHLSIPSQHSHWQSLKNFGYFPLHKAAKRGHRDVVRVLIRKLKFNPNQYNHEFVTPLVSAIYSPFWLEMGRCLLDHGADPNRSTMGANHPLLIAVERNNADLIRLLLQYKADPNITHGAARVRETARNDSDDDDDDDDDDLPRTPAHTFVPLIFAVKNGNIEVTRLLLKHGADPNLHRAHQYANNVRYNRFYDPVVTDIAIKNGDTEILSMLLNRGAQCAQPGNGIIFHRKTALNDLLQDTSKSDKTKLAICRILVKSAKTSKAAARFVQSSLDAALINKQGYEFLLKAGMNPICAIYRAIGSEHEEEVCQLLVELGVDPFLEEEKDDGRGDPYLSGDNDDDHATSPFLAAAREEDSAAFDFFLDHWNERFSANGGKNDNGDYPIHVICCDKFVKLHAVELLLERQAHTLSTVDGEKGLFPFHFAAMWDASLEVIYFLMRHCPDALGRLPHVHPATKDNSNDAGIKDQTATVDVSPMPAETRSVLGTTASDDERLEWTKRLEDGPLKKKPKVSL